MVKTKYNNRWRGHQDGFRCGKTETYRDNFWRAGHQWVDYSNPLTIIVGKQGTRGWTTIFG